MILATTGGLASVARHAELSSRILACEWGPWQFNESENRVETTPRSTTYPKPRVIICGEAGVVSAKVFLQSCLQTGSPPSAEVNCRLEISDHVWNAREMR